MKVTFAVVGPGRAGRALTSELRRCGWELVGVLGRNPARTAEAVQELQLDGGPRLLTEWPAVRQVAQVIFVTTPDAALSKVAQTLASGSQGCPGPGPDVKPVALHLSGATPSDALAPLRAAGYAVGALHPLQTLADPQASLKGIAWGIEGDQGAVEVAEKIVELLAGTPLTIDRQVKPLYHAAAAVASNYLAVLIAMAAELLSEAGIPQETGVRALLPLVRGAVANVERLGLPDALTGPIERGDVATVESHLTAFAAYDVRPDVRTLYRRLGMEAVRMAMTKGSIEEHVASDLKELLAQNWLRDEAPHMQAEASDRR